MQHAFVIVVIVVAVIGVAGALAALLTSRRNWESLGRGGLLMESDLRDRSRRGPGAAGAPLSPAATAERDAEIRQMLEARNARRRRRGEPELDVEAELERLIRTTAVTATVDDELRAEIRDLVVARNLRRSRRGEPALDVDAEVEREIARFGEQPTR